MGRERKGKMLPPTRPPLPQKYSFGNCARACLDSVGFRACACVPSHMHSGNVGHPNTGVTLGWACRATWRVQGNTNGIPSFPPPGVATETNTARPSHATNFPASVHGEVSRHCQGWIGATCTCCVSIVRTLLAIEKLGWGVIADATTPYTHLESQRRGS